MSIKPLHWVGGSLARVRAFPEAARREVGHQLFQIQLGLDPGDWKPMPSVGPGVTELRIHRQGEYRVLYLARLGSAVYVLHAFEKRTRQTRKPDIEVARRNLAEIRGQHSRQGAMMASKVRRSSGNVFRDLGFSTAEAESLRIRSELMARIRRLIDDNELTQARAARLLGVSQPRISNLVRGRIDLFSIDTLVDMLAKAGIRVSVTTRSRAA